MNLSNTTTVEISPQFRLTFTTFQFLVYLTVLFINSLMISVFIKVKSILEFKHQIGQFLYYYIFFSRDILTSKKLRRTPLFFNFLSMISYKHLRIFPLTYPHLSPIVNFFRILSTILCNG